MFLQGDYIVLLKGPTCADFALQYIYKQRLDQDHLHPELDLKRSGTNAWIRYTFNKKMHPMLKDQYADIDWRYATPEEITEYNRLGKPYDVTLWKESPTADKLIAQAEKRFPKGCLVDVSNLFPSTKGSFKIKGLPSWSNYGHPAMIKVHVEGGGDITVYCNQKWANIVALPESVSESTSGVKYAGDYKSMMDVLKEAYQRYPPGTIFTNLPGTLRYIRKPGEVFKIDQTSIRLVGSLIPVYLNGQWAPIICQASADHDIDKSDIQKEAEKHGFVSGVKFIDMVKGQTYTIARDPWKHYKQRTGGTLYIAVDPHPNTANQTARIYDGAKWAQIVDNTAKLDTAGLPVRAIAHTLQSGEPSNPHYQSKMQLGGGLAINKAYPIMNTLDVESVKRSLEQLKQHTISADRQKMNVIDHVGLAGLKNTSNKVIIDSFTPPTVKKPVSKLDQHKQTLKNIEPQQPLVRKPAQIKTKYITV